MVLAIPVAADTDKPIQPYASYSFMWDSNIFRLAGKDAARNALGSPDTGTVVHRLDVGIDGDVPVSRQHFIAQLNINRSRFERFGFLDYTGHDALIKWNWQAGNLWQGSLGYSDRRTLASYRLFHSPVQNLVSTTNPFLEATYTFRPHWRLRGKVNRREVNYGAEMWSVNDVRLDSIETGFDYVSRPENRLGVRLNATDGSYPNRQVVASSLVDNSYRQTEVDALANWLYSGRTHITTKLGYVHRAYHQLSTRDFSGAVGRVDVQWRAAGSTVVHFALWRRVSAYQNLISSYVVNDGGRITPTWNPTAKLTVKGQLLYESLSYQGDPGFLLTQTPVRNDTVRSAELSLTYTPFPQLTLDVSYQWERRNSNYRENNYLDNLITADVGYEFL